MATDISNASGMQQAVHHMSVHPDTLTQLADVLEVQSTRMSIAAYEPAQEAVKMLRMVASNLDRAADAPAARVRHTQAPAAVVASLRIMAKVVRKSASGNMVAAADMLENLVACGQLFASAPVLKRRASD